jgi:hypothetical protein
MSSPAAARRTTPPAAAGTCSSSAGAPVRFISTVTWSAEETRAGSSIPAGGAGSAFRLHQPAASKQPPRAARSPPEGIPPMSTGVSIVTRTDATAAGEWGKPEKELETLLSEPTTPPERPPPEEQPAAAAATVAAATAAGGDPHWQAKSAHSGNGGSLARSDSDWADAGYVLMPTEDLLDAKVQELVQDWGAYGYLQLPDTDSATVAPKPGAGMTVQDGPASFGRWVMLRDSPSPLQQAALAPSDAAAAVGGYVRLGSPGAPGPTGSQRESVSRLVISPIPLDEDEEDGDGALDGLGEASAADIDMGSPTGGGEGCLPAAELDEIVQEYAALPARESAGATPATAAAAAVDTAARSGTQPTAASGGEAGEADDIVAPSSLGQKASGLPGLRFDFVTSAERCELYLTESHQQLEDVARSVTEKRGGEVPANWRVEVDLQRKSSKTLAASRPLLARGGASSDSLAHLVDEASAALAKGGGAKILSEAELPNLAAWGL